MSCNVCFWPKADTSARANPDYSDSEIRGFIRTTIRARWFNRESDGLGIETERPFAAKKVARIRRSEDRRGCLQFQSSPGYYLATKLERCDGGLVK